MCNIWMWGAVLNGLFNVMTQFTQTETFGSFASLFSSLCEQLTNNDITSLHKYAEVVNMFIQSIYIYKFKT